jgi:ppGpp synthetase/RelA/SpoT-type nucleotidyltranferase
LHAEFAYVTDQDREAPVYTIKTRIKSFASLEKKLLSRAEDLALPEVYRKQAKRLLYENLISISEILAVIHDLVGARVVWFFEQAKQVAASRILDLQPDHWFHLLTEDGTPAIRVLPAHEKVNLLPALEPYKRPVEDSRYTSIHMVGSLSSASTLHKKFGDLTLELQFRTLFEEAWSEISHYLDYKGLRVEASQRILKDAKIHLIPIDEGFAHLSEETLRLRSHRLHPYLQLAQHYPIDSHGRIAPIWIAEYESAYPLRLEGKFQESLQRLHKALEDISSVVPAEHEERLHRRLLCDIAVCHLHLRQHEEAKRAIREAKSRGMDGPQSFWANFREAELLRRQRKYEKASDACSAALRRLRERRNDMWCSTAGLEADVLCYSSFVRWSKAYDAYANAHKTEKVNERKLGIAHEAHDEAIVLAREAYDHAKASADSSAEVRARAGCSLMHLLVWRGKCNEETRALFLEIEAIGRQTPSDLGKMAWALLTGAVQVSRQEQLVASAERLCEAGLTLTRNQPPQVGTKLANRLGALRALIENAKREQYRVVERVEWFRMYES